MKTFEQYLKEDDLTSKERDDLSNDQFALPDQRKYPIPDKEHAANAKARAKQELDKGDLSQSDYDKVVKAADAVLNK